MATVIDNKKKERTNLRRYFSRKLLHLKNLLENEHTDPDDLTAAVEIIQPRIQTMFDLDEEIYSLLISNEAEEKTIDQETDQQDEYRLKWINIKKKVDARTYPLEVACSVSNQINSRYKSLSHCNCQKDYLEAPSSMEHKKQIRKFNLPKLELKKFDGNIKNWLSFWGQFRKIDEDKELDDDDKYQYLLQSMETGTDVRAIVESFPPSGLNYRHALEQLRTRFARDDLLIEVYVRELLALVLMQARDGKYLSITSLYDRLSAQIRALESLGVTKEKYSAFIYPMIESALPRDLLKIWERSQPYLPNTESSDKELSNLLDFLKKEVNSEQRVNIAHSTFLETERITINPEIPSAECLVTNIKQADPKQCIFCEKTSHVSVECYKLQKMDLEQRKEFLNKKKACNVCLKSGHFAKFCKSYTRCCICAKRHSVILCPGKTEESTGLMSGETEIVSNNFAQVPGITLLQTMMVHIVNGKRKMTVRALLDSGAQRSYIKKSITEGLGLKPVSKEVLSHSLFGGIKTKMEELDVYDCLVQSLNSSFRFSLSALVKNRICGDIPCVDLSDRKLSNLLKINNVSLTDKGIDNKEIGLLLGADFIGFLMTKEVVCLGNGMTAIKTKLGWTIIGRQSGVTTGVTCNINSLFCSTDLETFWSLETLGIKDPTEVKNSTQRDAQVLADFKNSIVINSEGRYEVQLPWMVGHEDLLSNYDLAKGRLLSTTKRLEARGKLSDYNAVFNEWLELGIIETVSEFEDHHESGHYLSHHAVINEARLTTKTRPVFNASAKDKNGKSLNSCLDKGINLVQNILKLLIRFRKGAIGITADIAKAFLQISIVPKERQFLKFLWWKDDSATETITYRHCRVVFGLTPSPFLLSATILHHLEGIDKKYRSCAYEMSRSFYVDNCITSVDSEEDAQTFMTEAKEIMSRAKFDLRQWVLSPMQINETNKKEISVLGLTWDTVSDELYCKIDLPLKENIDKCTKRIILSLTQKIFDPIGFTCPVTLIPRILLQEMWRRKLGWDEEIPKDILYKFLKWYEHVPYINKYRIPRRMSNEIIKDCQVTLHTFCDACKEGYAACVFLRCERGNSVSVQLLAAKSRVTPPKLITIPRLELTSALIAIRLMTEVKKGLDFPIEREYYWCDSTVTLCWIKRELEWNTFVGNRIKEIREHSDPQDWHHIPGSLNWADLASRGCDAKQLLESHWFEGPSWLLNNLESWPKSEFDIDESEAVKELKKSTCNIVVTLDDNFLDRFTYFSKYTKIIRTLAWILRFINNVKKSNNKTINELSYDEFETAERKMIMLVQIENKEYMEKRCSNLRLCYDTDNLIRVETKLTLGDFTESTKKPLIVPANNYIIRRMVEERHQQLQHAGSNIMITDIRQRFWILGIRLLVKSVLNKCVVCRRFRTKRMETITAPLPKDRVNSSGAFDVTGVDLAGPLYLRGNEKCWIVLYTCAVYRAVHLELTKSLSTQDFLMSLRRFVARRGRVRVIMSDNGTNFVGANNLFANIDWNEVQRHSNIVRIKWKFNVPSAPWWGGYWERLIKILKDLLRKVLGKASVSYVELQTILCDCEAIINNRPLTYVEDDTASSLEPLTPSCFLHPLTTSDVSDLDTIDRHSLNCRLQYLQKLRDDFKQRFQKEYLTSLLQKGKQNIGNLEIGDVVIVETEEKRLKWPLGLVLDIIKGTDGVPRAAKLKTHTGVIMRPFQKLYRLEVPSDCIKNSNGENISQLKTRYGRIVKVPSRLNL